MFSTGAIEDKEFFQARLSTGLKNILLGHFKSLVNRRKQAPDTFNKQVLICVTHTKAINGFMKSLNNQEMLKPCFNWTAAIEIELNTEKLKEFGEEKFFEEPEDNVEGQERKTELKEERRPLSDKFRVLHFHILQE